MFSVLKISNKLLILGQFVKKVQQKNRYKDALVQWRNFLNNKDENELFSSLYNMYVHDLCRMASVSGLMRRPAVM